MTTKQFEITGKCNLHCETCFNWELMKQLKNIEVENVLKKVSEGDVVYIGGGEPMSHPKVQELVEKLVEIPSEAVITTNGTIYKKMPKQAQIQISVWTLNLGLYNKIQRRTEKQLDKLKENISKYLSDGNPVLINMPVYEQNFNEINSVSDYANSLNLPLRINPIFSANGFSVDSDLEKKIENSVFKLKLQGRNIIYSKNKMPVERFYSK